MYIFSCCGKLQDMFTYCCILYIVWRTLHPSTILYFICMYFAGFFSYAFGYVSNLLIRYKQMLLLPYWQHVVNNNLVCCELCKLISWFVQHGTIFVDIDIWYTAHESAISTIPDYICSQQLKMTTDWLNIELLLIMDSSSSLQCHHPVICYQHSLYINYCINCRPLWLVLLPVNWSVNPRIDGAITFFQFSI